MRDLPILFSAPMVRAILDGRKTVTRRVVSRIGTLGPVTEFGRSDTPGYDWHCRDRRALWNDLRDAELLARCPYGEVGDRLWVRETTFQQAHPSELGMTERDLPHTWTEVCERSKVVFYRADVSDLEGLEATDGMPWKPSIHMPKARARIWLEVTAVRVERLQDISEEQAIAEGIRELPLQEDEPGAWWCADPLGNPELHCRTPRAAFCRLWESINGAGSWAANPWVWVVEFKRIEKELPHGRS